MSTTWGGESGRYVFHLTVTGTLCMYQKDHCPPSQTAICLGDGNRVNTTKGHPHMAAAIPWA